MGQVALGIGLGPTYTEGSSGPSPTDITWGGSHSVAEDAALGTQIGSAITSDLPGATFTLSNTAGGLFDIRNGFVIVSGVLDYETATSHNITITSNRYSEVFAVTVTDVTETVAPSNPPPTGGTIVVEPGEFINTPIVTAVDDGIKFHGKKGGASGKFVYNIGVPVAGTTYTMRYDPDFSLLANLGVTAMVGFGFKQGNNFRLSGLKGDGSTGLKAYEIYGSNWNQTSGFSTSDGGAALFGTQAGPNWLQLSISASGATYTLRTSSDGVTWSDEFTDIVPAPEDNVVADYGTFGIAVFLEAADAGNFSVLIDLWIAVVVDDYWSKVVLLMGFEGTNNSTTFVDESPNRHPNATGVDNAKISTSSPLVGTSSLAIDGTNDGIYFANSVDWRLSLSNSEPWTMEATVKPGAPNSWFRQFIAHTGTGVGNEAAWAFRILNTEQLHFYGSPNGVSPWDNLPVSVGLSWTSGTTYTVAADKDATGKIRIYRNGVMVGSGTPSSSVDYNTGGQLYIGTDPSNSSFYTGMDEIRITKGLARYASDSGYTPVTGAFPRGSETWDVVSSAVLSGNDTSNSNWAGVNIRTVIAPTVFNASGGTKVRVTFVGGSAFNTTIVRAFIGTAAAAGDAYDFASTPTQLLFNGAAGLLVPAAEVRVTDQLTMAIDGTKSLIVSVYVSGGGVGTVAANPGWATYTKVTSDETGTANVSTYTDATNDAYFIGKVEVFGGTVADPYWGNVVLLVGAEGTDASTAFVDESSYQHAMTVAGDAQIDTAQFKFGSASALFDGTGDVVATTGGSAEFNFGSGNFTIEGWFRFTSITTTQTLISQWETGGAQRSWALHYMGADATDTLRIDYSTDGTAAVAGPITSAWTPVAGTWYHIALDRSGNVWRTYVDGVMKGSTTLSVTLFASNTGARIGGVSASGPISNPYNGWADEVRITKGVARYASDGGFTVPTTAFRRGSYLALDGTTPSSAFSVSRYLYSPFGSGTKYTTATGVDSLNDQSGNARHLTQPTGAAQPTLTTGGPNSRAIMHFDGTSMGLVSGVAASNFLSTTSAFCVCSFMVNAFDTEAGTGSSTYLNDAVWGDVNGNAGLVLRQTGPSLTAMNYDGNYDNVSYAPAAIATPYVVTWRHQSGSLFMTVNGGTEMSIATGTTSSMAGNFDLGRGFIQGNVKVWEFATFNTIPTLAQRNAIVSNWMTWVGASAASSTPLDGLSPTGAWSFSRDLLTSFAGGTKYTTATGVDSWKDQSGNSRHLGQTVSTTHQPLITTAGPNSRTCADFDGATDYLQGNAISDHFSATTGYIIVSFVADTVTLDGSGVVSDSGAYMAIALYDTPDELIAVNFDTTYDYAPAIGAGTTVTTGSTAYVAEWRHESGTLYFRVNGGTWSSVASGNTGSMVGVLNVGGRAGGTASADIKVFELATFSTVPTATQRDAICVSFKNWVGAV